MGIFSSSLIDSSSGANSWDPTTCGPAPDWKLNHLGPRFNTLQRVKNVNGAREAMVKPSNSLLSSSLNMEENEDILPSYWLAWNLRHVSIKLGASEEIFSILLSCLCWKPVGAQNKIKISKGPVPNRICHRHLLLLQVLSGRWRRRR